MKSTSLNRCVESMANEQDKILFVALSIYFSYLIIVGCKINNFLCMFVHYH